MRNRIVAAVAVAVVSVVPMVSAGAADPEPLIVFNGSGSGHGVGMSQWGAYARALEGQTYDQILAGADGLGYYQGATIGTIGTDVTDPGPIFTNVASDITSTTLTVLDGPGEAHDGIVVTRLTGGETATTATLLTGDTIVIVDTTPAEGSPDGCEATLTISHEVTVWETGTCDFSVTLAPGDSLPGHLLQATSCRSSNCTFGYGVQFHLVDNGSNQRLAHDTYGPNGTGLEWPGFDLVVESTLDDYTRSITEVPFSWPMDALKTQAIAARSYGAAAAVARDHLTAGCFCDVRSTSYDQTYAGWIGGRDLADEWEAATASTTSQILLHPGAPAGGIVQAYYGASNGGASESVKDKWGADLPYLVSIPDPWSLVEANWAKEWTFKYTASDVVDKIWGTDVDYTLTSAEVIATNDSGSAKTVRFRAEEPGGKVVVRDVSSSIVTSAFDLHSWYFSIDDDEVDPPPTTTTTVAPTTTSTTTQPPLVGSASVGVQDPRSGVWTLHYGVGINEDFYFGNPDDIPFIGDWNGNGIDTIGLYRESAGFLFLRYTNTQGIADIDIYYGNPGDLPVAGDWDGDGDDTVGIFRPSQSRFYLRNTNTQGIADADVAFGQSGDVPIAGDWDGDGVDTVGVYRESTQMVYLTNSVADGEIDFSYHYAGAAPGDHILAGDWNQDGVDTIGVFRPSSATFYLRDTFTQSSANIVVQLGRSWMNPVAGYWGQ